MSAAAELVLASFHAERSPPEAVEIGRRALALVPDVPGELAVGLQTAMLVMRVHTVATRRLLAGELGDAQRLAEGPAPVPAAVAARGFELLVAGGATGQELAQAGESALAAGLAAAVGPDVVRLGHTDVLELLPARPLSGSLRGPVDSVLR